MMRLAASVDRVSEQSVGVSVVKSRGGGKLGSGSVSVAQILSALDLGEMGGLVEGGGGLVLGVARLGKSGKSAEVERAVDDVASRREGVGEDVGRAAVAVNISAVSLGGTGGGRSTLRGGLGEDALDSADGAGRSRLEVFLDLGCVGSSGGRGGASERSAVGKSVHSGRLLGARAISLNRRPLDKVTADLLGLCTVDVGCDSVASVLNRAAELRGVDSSSREGTSRGDVEGTAGA